MSSKIVAALVLAVCCLAAAAPQSENLVSVRPTRQVLPIGGYPAGAYAVPVAPYATALPAAGAVYRRPVVPGVVRTSPGPVAPSGPEGAARIINQIQDGPDFAGNFNYAFETENGISTQTSGALTNPGTEVEGQAMRGSFSYTSPEGLPITVNWYADETGFHAEGEHLPRQPVVPTGPEVPTYPYGAPAGVRGPVPVGRVISPAVVGPRPGPVPLIRTLPTLAP